jgi:site-specific DNA-methyltransferase (adenine-specific)
MSKVVTIGNATLYLGDCRDVVPTLGAVDAVVTDPPYEIGDGWSGGGFCGNNGASHMWKEPPPAWDKLCRDGLFLALEKAQQAIVWGGHLYGLPARSRWLAWDKMQKFSSGDFELAWTSEAGATRIFRMSRIDAHQNIGEKKQHPTQKPVPLMEWCLSFLPAANSILDPFAGSGSTGVAAMRMGKRFIGIEKEHSYFEIACERIAAAQSQGRLFA